MYTSAVSWYTTPAQPRFAAHERLGQDAILALAVHDSLTGLSSLAELVWIGHTACSGAVLQRRARARSNRCTDALGARSGRSPHMGEGVRHCWHSLQLLDDKRCFTLVVLLLERSALLVVARLHEHCKRLPTGAKVDMETWVYKHLLTGGPQYESAPNV